MNIFNSKFFIVYLLTFVNGLSFTLLIPVFPVLIKTYGQPEIVLGILAASYSLFQFFGAPILGDLSDKYGRKLVLLLTQGGTFLSWIILGGAYFLPDTQIFGFLALPIFVILLSRIIDGVTGGNMSVISAMISDLTTKEERTVVLGRNGAVIGISLIIGPSLGAFAMTTGYGFLGTAIFGGVISFMTLCIMLYRVEESLPIEKRKKDIVISYKQLNILSKISKYWGIQRLRFSIWIKAFFNTAFTMYATVSVLYLMDRFDFSTATIGYYLMITGSFLIFHQSVSIGIVVKKVGDLYGLLIGKLFMGLGFLGMGFSGNIYLYTLCYFFAVFGISLAMTTIQALFSKSADEQSQGEIMGISSSIESVFSIIGPLLGTLVYSYTHNYFYVVVSILPFMSLLFYQIFFKKRLHKHKSFCS